MAPLRYNIVESTSAIKKTISPPARWRTQRTLFTTSLRYSLVFTLYGTGRAYRYYYFNAKGCVICLVTITITSSSAVLLSTHEIISYQAPGYCCMYVPGIQHAHSRGTGLMCWLFLPSTGTKSVDYTRIPGTSYGKTYIQHANSLPDYELITNYEYDMYQVWYTDTPLDATLNSDLSIVSVTAAVIYIRTGVQAYLFTCSLRRIQDTTRAAATSHKVKINGPYVIIEELFPWFSSCSRKHEEKWSLSLVPEGKKPGKLVYGGMYMYTEIPRHVIYRSLLILYQYLLHRK